MRTTLFILLFLLNCLPMVGQGIVRPFEGLEGHRLIVGPDDPTVAVMECDEEGNLYIAGTFEQLLRVVEGTEVRFSLNGMVGNPSLYFMKLDSNLDVIWVKTMPFEGRDFSIAERIRFDNEGNPILQGKYQYNIQFDDGTFLGDTLSPPGSSVFFAKVDSDGNWLDIWDIRTGDEHIWLGDFRVLDGGGWKIAIKEVKLPMYLHEDTIGVQDSPFGGGESQMVDISLDSHHTILNKEFIYKGRNARIIANLRSYVDIKGNSYFYFWVRDSTTTVNLIPEWWVGLTEFRGEGWKLVKLGPTTNFLSLSDSIFFEYLDFYNPMEGNGIQFFIGGVSNLGKHYSIFQMNGLNRVGAEFDFSGNRNDHISDLVLIGDDELWVAGWTNGILSGEKWSVGIEVPWPNYQPRHGFLMSINLLTKKVNWVQCQPLLRDRNELFEIKTTNTHFYLHSSWQSDTLLFDTLGLNDISVFPKEFIGKFRLPENQDPPSDIQLDVWPNPADDHVWIDLSENWKEIQVWYLYDYQGKCLVQESENRQRFVSLETSSFSEGVYYFVIQLESGSTIKQIIIVNHP